MLDVNFFWANSSLSDALERRSSNPDDVNAADLDDPLNDCDCDVEIKRALARAPQIGSHSADQKKP